MVGYISVRIFITADGITEKMYVCVCAYIYIYI